jgi:hypothetical protein
MAGFAMALQAEFDLLARVGGFSVGESELIGHVLANTLWLSNEDAMATLHRGFSGGALGARRRFLSRAPEVLDTVALPGVVVHVLGPSREESVLADMDPPSGESFLRAAPVGGDGGDAVLPFAVDPSPEVVLPEELRALLARISRESALLGAVSLEKAVNNTSLMLAFEVGEAVLLFPGDAQWGAWKVNLDDPRAVGLLERTTFYKVGHHGSHNATPPDPILELILPVQNPDGRERTALISTCENTYGGVPHGPTKARLEMRCDAVLNTESVDPSEAVTITFD